MFILHSVISTLSKGTLIINIRERNSGPPEFGNGWTPDDPYIRLRVNEEEDVGTLVTVLRASDPTDAIQRFQLTKDPSGYLTVDATTGKPQFGRCFPSFSHLHVLYCYSLNIVMLLSHPSTTTTFVSGALRIARPIDYETDKQFEAEVIVVDSGQPSLTSTATIVVDVNNLNDNSPVFSQVSANKMPMIVYTSKVH